MGIFKFQSSIARGQHFLPICCRMSRVLACYFSPLSLEDSISCVLSLDARVPHVLFQSSIARGQHFLWCRCRVPAGSPGISVLYRSRTAFLVAAHTARQDLRSLFQSSIARGQHFLCLHLPGAVTHRGHFSPLSLEDSIS